MQIENTFSYLAPSLFAFYMLIACNFLPEIFGCKLQTLLKTSMLAKHVTGFILLFFLVIYVKPDNVDNQILYNIGLSAIIYIWFFMTTRCPFPLLILNIVLLIIIYIIDIRKTRLTDDKDKNKKELNDLENYQKIITVIIILFTIIGFVYYFGQKKLEYRDQFSIYKFLVGTRTCRNSNNYPINRK
jgi:hypothetical protein